MAQIWMLMGYESNKAEDGTSIVVTFKKPVVMGWKLEMRLRHVIK